MTKAALALLVAAGLAGSLIEARGHADDPFAFFSPSVRLTPADLAELDGGSVIVRSLPADDGHLAVFAATRISAPPAALFGWTREIAALKRGPMVLAVGRFSDPPSLADVRALSLEPAELDALRRCRVGNCSFKLAADEIAAVRHAIAKSSASWESSAQEAVRAIILGRVLRHREQGLLALPPYADKAHGLSVGEAFSSIVARSPYLIRAFPDAVTTLQTPALRGGDADEAFYYWSRERYGAGKSVITVTYVRLLREQTSAVRAFTISTQLFASHYINGAVGLTAIVCAEGGGRCYLAYLNRTQTDLLGGLFGGLKRSLAEQRLDAGTPAILRTIKERIESGPPPVVE